MWLKIKRFFWVIGCFLAMKCRLYYLWSWIYRLIPCLGRKYKNVPMPDIKTMKELTELLQKIDWLPDRHMQLWDQIGWPGRVIRGLEDNSVWKKHGNDCDEHAILSVEILRKLPEYDNVYIMSVIWLGETKEDSGGHNVCVYQKKSDDTWGYVGNWFNGYPREGFLSPDIIAKDVAQRGGGELVAWGMADYKLRYIDSRIG